jgi:hypothetical protein
MSPTPILERTNSDKKPFIGDIMREVLCKLSKSLGEPDITAKIVSEFDTFVKQAGIIIKSNKK